MRTLLIESSAGAGAGAAAALESAGHQVMRCHHVGSQAFPCADVVIPGSCPLGGSSAADVVLVVRARSAADRSDNGPTPAEAGVTCALRVGTPVAVLGDPADNPFIGWTSQVSGDEPVSLCERAIESARDELVMPLRDEVVRRLNDAGAHLTAQDVTVTLEQQQGRVRIHVTTPEAMPLGAETIATHLHAAYLKARVGSDVRVVDVAVGFSPRALNRPDPRRSPLPDVRVRPRPFSWAGPLRSYW